MPVRLMVEHAAQLGADTIIGARYDAAGADRRGD
jgi:uncharacterized protein YbjQ (UPF0145 family)